MNSLTSDIILYPHGVRIQRRPHQPRPGEADRPETAGSRTSLSFGHVGEYAAYDALNRLTAATGGTTNYSYGYDGAGDPTFQTVGGTTTTYTPNADGELSTNTYDAAGNTLTDPTIGTLAYNTAGQTSSITPTGGSAENLSYLDAGQTDAAAIGATSYTYNSLGIDTATTSSQTTDYLRTPNGSPLGEHLAGSTYYYLLNPQGSVLGLTNTTGTLVDHYTYSPYGTQTALANTVTNNYGYDSGLTIPGTNLIHFGARYYNPTENQWTQQDPSGQNPAYQYAGDNPTSEGDPSGLCGFVDCIVGAASAVGSAISTGYATISGAQAFSLIAAYGESFEITDLIAGAAAFGPAGLAGLGAVALGYGAYEAFSS